MWPQPDEAARKEVRCLFSSARFSSARVKSWLVVLQVDILPDVGQDEVIDAGG